MRAPHIRVGPAGWSYSDWEGRVYPKPHPRGFHALAFLATYVDCVEINATLYEKLNFIFIRDIAPVCGIIRVPPIHSACRVAVGGRYLLGPRADRRGA